MQRRQRSKSPLARVRDLDLSVAGEGYLRFVIPQRLLGTAIGWNAPGVALPDAKRVQRIWRREGLKIPTEASPPAARRQRHGTHSPCRRTSSPAPRGHTRARAAGPNSLTNSDHKNVIFPLLKRVLA